MFQNFPSTVLTIIVGIVLCALGNSTSSNFTDESIITVSLWLSDAAYCPTNYLIHNFIGPSEGFVATANIEDNATDTHGYVGYHSDKHTIFVVFRGSSTLSNWYTDLDFFTVPYTVCDSCLVHEGFMFAFTKVRDQVYANLQLLQQKFPEYKVVVTGHSLGGALATITTLDLIQNAATKNVQLITFGQPRVGNLNFAEYAQQTLINPIRVTHYRDCVPHVPYHQVFYHINGELYEDELGQVRSCEGLEDPTCSYQWYYTTISDHMTYLGLPIGCKYVSDEHEKKRLVVENFEEPEESVKKMMLA